MIKYLISVVFLFSNIAAFAQDSIERFSLHFKQTFVEQYHPAFQSSVGSGNKSLSNAEESDMSSISTLYLSSTTWKNGEFYFNPEIAGGSGFSGATGLAGFSNGTTFRVGSTAPTLYIARLFFRQIIPLSKEKVFRESDVNILGRMVPTERLIITFGKFSMSDIFDQNVTSHDPTSSLLNWSLMDAGAWDYSSNTRGYTYALSVKLVKKKYIFRFCSGVNALWSNGLVTASNNFMPLPNDWKNAHGEIMELILPIKKDFSNSFKITLFANHGRMASYADANKILQKDTSLAIRNVAGGLPTNLNDGTSHLVSPVLDNLRGLSNPYYGKAGIILNWEMKLDKKGEMIFVRTSWNDGKRESWMYTEIDKSFTFGGFISGARFHRPEDMIRVGFATNGISKQHADYLQAGGYGFIIGDGLGNYPQGIKPELIAELQYNFKYNFMILSPDYQFVINPAYNPARGPVHIFGLRAAFQF